MFRSGTCRTESLPSFKLVPLAGGGQTAHPPLASSTRDCVGLDMTSFSSLLRRPVTRRRFFKAGLCGAAALALYSSEIERHWTEVTHLDIALRGLPQAF